MPKQEIEDRIQEEIDLAEFIFVTNVTIKAGAEFPSIFEMESISEFFFSDLLPYNFEFNEENLIYDGDSLEIAQNPDEVD